MRPGPEAPILRTLILFVAAMALGALVGSLGALLTRAVYPMLLVPAGMAVIAGALLGLLVFAFDARSRLVTSCLALLAWASVMTTFHWVEYRVGFLDAVHYYAQVDAPLSGDLVEDTDSILESATGHRGFVGFLLLRIEAGARLRLFRGLGTQDWLAATTWGLDLALALGILWVIVERVRKRLTAGLPSAEPTAIEFPELDPLPLPLPPPLPILPAGQAGERAGERARDGGQELDCHAALPAPTTPPESSLR